MTSESDLEDDVSSVLRQTSILDEVFEPLQAEETSYKVKMNKKNKEKKSKRQ